MLAALIHVIWLRTGQSSFSLWPSCPRCMAKMNDRIMKTINSPLYLLFPYHLLVSDRVPSTWPKVQLACWFHWKTCQECNRKVQHTVLSIYLSMLMLFLSPTLQMKCCHDIHISLLYVIINLWTSTAPNPSDTARKKLNDVCENKRLKMSLFSYRCWQSVISKAFSIFSVTLPIPQIWRVYSTCTLQYEIYSRGQKKFP